MITAREAKANSQLALHPAPIAVILEALDFRIRHAANDGDTGIDVTVNTLPMISNYFLEENVVMLKDLILALQNLGYEVTFYTDKGEPFGLSKWVHVSWS